jgi:acetyl-CoA acetyltransferase
MMCIIARIVEELRMRYADAAIPAGFAWSSPFARWQGSLAALPGLDLAVTVTTRALADREVDPAAVNGLTLGWTVPQPDIFYGAPTLAGRIGMPGISGPMISQACATSVACLHAAASAALADAGSLQLLVAMDRTSNGPQLIYPQPSAQGGAPLSFNWVIDSFGHDPWAGTSMLAAGDAVAAELGISKPELDDLKVMRHDQYERGLADDRAFQRRYQVPVEVESRKARMCLSADEGIRALDPEAIRKLPPVTPDGVHSFAAQTHPADGCAGALVTSVERARELAAGNGVARILATGFARVAKTRMPEAPVPAALAALADAGLDIDQVDAVTTHNPFAVNDLYFSRMTGYPLERMNCYGCSLIFGHPQAPTGLRSISELIEELRIRGGGIGLFTGCAAGDTGAAAVIAVTD